MPVREGPPQPAPPPASEPHKMPPVDGPEPYPAKDARGGEIVLRTPVRRIIFLIGLIGAVILGILLAVFA